MGKETGKRGGRGFAGMDPAMQRRIASMGGLASQQSGRGHKFSSEEAREAGKRSHIARKRNAAA